MKSTLLLDMRRAAREGNTATLFSLLRPPWPGVRRDTHAEKCLRIAIENGHDALAIDLLRWGARAETEDADRWEPLLITCADSNQPDLTRELMARGADPSTRDSCNRTPLVLAAMRGSLEVAQVLVEAGADLEAHSAGTPLCWAARMGHTELARFLLSRGAQPDTPTHSALAHAIDAGEPDVVRLLLRAGSQQRRRLFDNRMPWDALSYARRQHTPNAGIIALLEAARAQNSAT